MRTRIRTTTARPRTAAARAAVLAAGALALAACSTTATAGPTSSASAGGEPGPGVTADTITIGVLTLGGANSAGSGGFLVLPQGDTKAEAEAVAAAINAEGGIAGRQVKVVVREFDSSTSSPTTETAVCKSFTQDDKVFAVLTLGQRTTASRSCYAKAGTLDIDISQAAQPESTYTSLAPYYWTPNSVALDVATRSMISSLDGAGWFEGAKVGVLVEKDPSFEGVYKDTVAPAFTALGITPVEQTIDQSTTENAFGTAGAAASAFQAAGVDRVLFLGRPDNVGYFTSFTTQQAYFPKLAIGSFETPQFVSLNPSVYDPKSLAGAEGIGFFPDVDGATSDAFPQPGAEQACIDKLGKAGITFDSRGAAKTAMRFCDGLGFLKAAGDKVGKDAVLNAASIAAAAATLGTTWQAATTIQTAIGTEGSSLYAPAAAFRPLAWNGTSFEYTGTATPWSTS